LKIQPGDAGVVLAVRVIPRAKKNAVDGLMADGTLKVRLAAPPVEGKANQALVRYLAEILDVPAGQIEIIAGQRGRNKLISVKGINSEVIQARISGRNTGEG
jgi:uncharacterized protein (TIGR00251 family)